MEQPPPLRLPLVPGLDQRDLAVTVHVPKGRILVGLSLRVACGHLEVRPAFVPERHPAEAPAAQPVPDAQPPQPPQLPSRAQSLQAEQFTRAWLAGRLDVWKAGSPPDGP